MVIYSSSDSKLKEEIEPLLNSLKHQTIIKRRELKKQNKKVLVNKLKVICLMLLIHLCSEDRLLCLFYLVVRTNGRSDSL